MRFTGCYSVTSYIPILPFKLYRLDLDPVGARLELAQLVVQDGTYLHFTGFQLLFLKEVSVDFLSECMCNLKHNRGPLVFIRPDLRNFRFRPFSRALAVIVWPGTVF